MALIRFIDGSTHEVDESAAAVAESIENAQVLALTSTSLTTTVYVVSDNVALVTP